MLLDIEDLDHGSAIRTQVCVVGAGAAGVTLARRLGSAGVNVVLLESGGRDFEASLQDLNAGAVEGLPYYPLARSRLRFFGGTTAIWGGRSAPLDAIDLERRSWIPHSGWPLSHDELAAWYGPAREVLEIADAVSPAELWRHLGVTGPAFDQRRLSCGVWEFDEPPGRFDLANCGDLIRSTRVAIVTHATALHLQCTANGHRLQHVDAGALSGRRFRVLADHVVLAAGGLENPRLLLNADDVQHGGIGNARDLVGRYFMEHPHGRAGRVVTGQPWKLLRYFTARHSIRGRRVAVYLRPADLWQRRRQGLNTVLTLACRRHPDDRIGPAEALYRAARHSLQPNRRNRRLWVAVKRASWLTKPAGLPWQSWLSARSGRRGLYAVLRAEQSPNPASRIRLGDEVDAVGLRRLHLDWRLSDLDRHGARQAVAALDAELRRLGLGRVDMASWLADQGSGWEFDPLVSAHPIGGFHHMGTTRMASDPSRGVVDEQCRVFGTDNLWVAGSSVFPTAGWANPTLTLIALSLRLAEHLAAQLTAAHSGIAGEARAFEPARA